MPYELRLLFSFSLHASSTHTVAVLDWQVAWLSTQPLLLLYAHNPMYKQLVYVYVAKFFIMSNEDYQPHNLGVSSLRSLFLSLIIG